jgi:DNA polymerase-1
MRAIITSLGELEEFCKDFNWYKYSVDTETTSLSYYDQELVGISLCDGVNACYIPIGHKLKTLLGEEYDPSNLPVDSVVKILKPLMKRGVGCVNQLTIGHNLTFDVKVLTKYGINLYNNEWFCTMVACHLLDENRKTYSLKTIVNEEFGDDYGIDTSNIQYVDIAKAGEYAMKDAEYTFKLFGMYSEKLHEEGLTPLFRKVEMPFLRVIVEMETQGIYVDKELMSKTTKDLQQAIIKFEEELYQVLGKPYSLQTNLYGDVTKIVGKIDFNSSQQLIKVIKDLGLEIKYQTPKGNPSSGKKTIDSLEGKHPFIDVLKKYKVAQKLLSGFFVPMPAHIDGDGRVRASFRDIGTATGRLSCNNPNLQQLPVKNDSFPVETRACFRATPGYTMVSADFSGQELRVLAHVTGDEGMIQAFKEGRDFHQEVADNMGISRKKAKIFNFSLAYGKTSKGLAEDWGMTEDEAQALIDKHYEKYTAVKDKMNETFKLVNNQGWVSSEFGRRRRFIKVGGKYSGKDYRKAFNFLIQGFSADMSRTAGVRLLNLKNRNPDWDLRILAAIHDEFVMEVKTEYVEEAMDSIKYAMEHCVKLKVPVLSDVKRGDSYATAK